MPTNKTMVTKRAAKQRRAEVEAAKRRARQRERRHTWMLTGLAVIIGTAIIAAVVVQQALTPPPIEKRKLTAFGASLKSASCSAVESPTSLTYRVIGAGAPDKTLAKITKGTYASVPPVAGDGFVNGITDNGAGNFYEPVGAVKLRPEQAVTSERHGWTIVWYDPKLPAKQIQTLRDMLKSSYAPATKFAVAPWDSGYGALPSGKHVVMATWGHRQACGKVSGAAIDAFVKAFPPSKAPEASKP